MNGEPLYLVALGASTALGRCAWSSAAALRAAISGFCEHPEAIDTAGEPIKVAMASWLEPALPVAERFEALLMPAIEHALAEHALDPARVALALALPSARPGLDNDLPARLLRRASRQFAARFSTAASFIDGHSAGYLALGAARRKLEAGQLDACVVAGAESYLDVETLEWLEDRDQVHGAGEHNNAWGFVPGEGAGALLLMRETVAERLALAPLAKLLGDASGFEPNHYGTERVCIGTGLSETFSALFEHLPAGATITDIVCDANGEAERADEYGFACLRVGEVLASASDFIAPAEGWGDVGAASAPLHLALAAIAGVKQYANGDLAMTFALSDTGRRGAALLRLAGAR